MSVVRQVVLLLAFSSVASFRPRFSDEKPHGPSLYEKLTEGIRELNYLKGKKSEGKSRIRMCEHLGGFHDLARGTKKCACKKLWSEACGHYVPLKSGGKVLDLMSPLSSGIDVDQFVSQCYCQKTFAESRAGRKKVEVSALRFCQTIFEDINKNVQVATHYRSETVSREAQNKLVGANGAKARCQRALTRPWESSTWLESGKGSNSAGRLGRMGHRWKWHLDQVCHDECEKLVDKMFWESKKMAEDIALVGVPTHRACADRVVKKVEANLLGCCGRSCGWDGHSCAMWPFLEEDQQRLWQVECCGEYTVLKGSDRERMCDSVLTADEKRLADQDDTDGTDEDAKSVGQNEQGSSLIEIFQQKGELGCNDKTFMENCPKDIKAMHGSKCKELGNWKAVNAANWGANYHEFQDGCGVVGSRGSPKDCRDKGGRVFTWKWAEEAAKRTSECCTLKEQSSLPAGKAANTVKSIRDLMEKLVMFVP